MLRAVASSDNLAINGGLRLSATALYLPYGYGGSGSATSTLTGSRIYYEPFRCLGRTAWTKMGISVTTLESGKAARLGIYSMVGGLPSTKLLDAGTVSLTNAAVVEATITYTMDPGWYFLALISDATGTAALRGPSVGTGSSQIQSVLGVNDTGSNTTTQCVWEAGSGTTLPTTAAVAASLTNLQAAPPLIYLRGA